MDQTMNDVLTRMDQSINDILAPMRAATLLALMGVSRPIYHLIISNEAILIVLII